MKMKETDTAKPAKPDEPGPFARIADAIEADAFVQAKAALEKAENKHDELSRSLQRAKDDAAASRAKAHAIAYDAIDDDAAKRLASKLLGDATRLDEECTHRIEPAVAEAAKRVDAARKVVAHEERRRLADEACGLAAQLEELGRQMDEGLAQAAEAQRKALAIIGRLNNIGAGSPKLDNVRVLVERQVGDILRRSGLYAGADLLLPGSRSPLAPIFGEWTRMTTNWAANAKSGPAATDRSTAA
jgi:hypothetical protein